ncbi:MAG: hypothetical protein KJO30_05645 [Boseongicola sp.]|nr:hypothetical protein [Boseongicola sp.]
MSQSFQRVFVISKVIIWVKRAWSAAPVATAVLVVALVACLFFGARAALFWHGWPPRAERDQPVAAWMTPRYISRSWRIPPDLVIEALDAPRPPPDGPMSLRELAEHRGVPLEQVVAEVEALIASQRPSLTDDEATE